jgi:hypothetical protein
MGWITDTPQTLTEQVTTTIEQVIMPGGQLQFRPKQIIRYVATFDTPATPAQSNNPLELRCSNLGHPDEFSFGLRIKGANAAGQPAVATAFVGRTPQGPTVSLGATMAAKTTQLVIVNQPQL